jgi:imidazoleglycerol-phosphate dehydratase
MSAARSASLSRKTAETDIQLRLVLDGAGRSRIETGVPFFDHMLTLFAKHGQFDLDVTCKGDVAVDYHHTVEDVGIVLGDAFKQALGDKKGITRYGFFYVPMDEALARVVVDLSGRAALAYDVVSPTMYVRDFNLILVKEFCRAFSNALACNLHVKLEYGEEPHHVAEAIFKSLARALDAAVRIDPRTVDQIPSTKGAL